MKKVSIKDVAAAANVSIATVSLVLSGKTQNGRVSVKTIERVKKLARDMNYQPNRLALGLKNGRSQTIGLLVADISNPFWGTIAHYIQEELEKAGYAVIIMNTDENHGQMARMVTLLQSRQVDGFIIAPPANSAYVLEELVKFKVPVVLIDRPYPSLPISSVVIDNYDSSYKGTQFLLGKNCKKIAFMMYDSELYNISQRLMGYEKAMEEAGRFHESLVYKVNHLSAETEVVKWLEERLNSLDPIDGVFFSTNRIAMIGITYLLKRKVNIGKDLHVLCYDKNLLVELIPGLVSYIEQPMELMCKEAASLLVERIKNPELSTENIELKVNMTTIG